MSAKLPSAIVVALLLGLHADVTPVNGAWQQSVGRRPLRAINSVAGKDLYREYCEQCHGAGGKGDGPAAAALKKPPADLTQIAVRNGGQFARSAVQAFISGERPGGRLDSDPQTAAPVIRYADGTLDEMPVYGILFRRLWQDQPSSIRCAILAKYVESIQAK